MWKKIAGVMLFAGACVGGDGAAPGAVSPEEAAEPAFVDESAPVSGGKADSSTAYSEPCRKQAVAAVGALEKQNYATTTVKQVELARLNGMLPELRVSIERKLNGKKQKDTYLVVMDPSGGTGEGELCAVAALRSESKVPYTLDPEMIEAGSTMVTPSAACQFAARKAVRRIIAINQPLLEQTVRSADEFVSKTAGVISVLVEEEIPEEGGGVFPYLYAVKTEPFGKSGCYVWGLQNGTYALDEPEDGAPDAP